MYISNSTAYRARSVRSNTSLIHHSKKPVFGAAESISDGDSLDTEHNKILVFYNKLKDIFENGWSTHMWERIKERYVRNADKHNSKLKKHIPKWITGSSYLGGQPHKLRFRPPPLPSLYEKSSFNSPCSSSQTRSRASSSVGSIGGIYGSNRNTPFQHHGFQTPSSSDSRASSTSTEVKLASVQASQMTAYLPYIDLDVQPKPPLNWRYTLRTLEQLSPETPISFYYRC